MNETNNSSLPADVIHAAVLDLIYLLASGEYTSAARSCSATRLSPDEIRNVIDDYGRMIVPPPPRAYSTLDIVEITEARVPTWSVRAPLYTAEEGRSDLVVEVTITATNGSVTVQLEDIHVI